MVDQPETPDPELAGKVPAPVVPAGTARKASARRRSPAKKKSAAKKTASAAKKAPAKKAAAPAKKAAAPAKKAVAPGRALTEVSPSDPPRVSQRAPRRPAGDAFMGADRRARGRRDARSIIAPIGDSTEPVISSIASPGSQGGAAPPPVVRAAAPAVGVPDVEPLRAGGERRNDRWALCVSVTEELLNDVVLMVVGDGVPLEALDTSLTLPGMGEVDLRLSLTVNGGSFQLRSEDGGRARVVITANGEVETRSAAYDGTTDQAGGLGGPMGVPSPPAPIPVRVEALVHPFVEVHSDHTVSLGLDLTAAELVSLEADSSAAVPDGVDAAAWAGILQVFGMMFGMLGHSLFASLGEHLGTVGTELGAEVGEALIELGVDPGRADVNVSSGLMSFGFAATDVVRGRAQPVPIAGRRIGLGLANSVVEHLTHKLLARVAGDLPVPFDIEVDLGEQRVGGRVRQSRLLPEPFPDLRSALRTEIRPRLLRGKLELSVQAAWLELPAVLPSFFNQVSRRLGELVSLAPIRVQIPARLELPLIPDVPDTIPVEIDDLRVTTNGLGVVVVLL